MGVVESTSTLCDWNTSANPSLFIQVTYNPVGFYEDEEGHTFGTVKKGVQRPLSNFTFEFVTKIVASNANSTGYIVKVTPESIRSEDNDSESEGDTSSR